MHNAPEGPQSEEPQQPEAGADASARTPLSAGAEQPSTSATMAPVQALLIHCAEQPFVTRIDELAEILMPAKLRPLPGAPSYLVGVLTLRAQPLPVLDLAERLGLAPEQRAQRQVWHRGNRILRVQGQRLDFGIIVQAVEGIRALMPEQWRRPTLAQGAGSSNGLISARALWLLDGKLVPEIGLADLLDSEEQINLGGASRSDDPQPTETEAPRRIPS